MATKSDIVLPLFVALLPLSASIITNVQSFNTSGGPHDRRMHLVTFDRTGTVRGCASAYEAPGTPNFQNRSVSCADLMVTDDGFISDGLRELFHVSDSDISLTALHQNADAAIMCFIERPDSPEGEVVGCVVITDSGFSNTLYFPNSIDWTPPAVIASENKGGYTRDYAIACFRERRSSNSRLSKCTSLVYECRNFSPDCELKKWGNTVTAAATRGVYPVIPGVALEEPIACKVEFADPSNGDEREIRLGCARFEMNSDYTLISIPDNEIHFGDAGTSGGIDDVALGTAYELPVYAEEDRARNWGVICYRALLEGNTLRCNAMYANAAGDVIVSEVQIENAIRVSVTFVAIETVMFCYKDQTSERSQCTYAELDSSSNGPPFELSGETLDLTSEPIPDVIVTTATALLENTPPMADALTCVLDPPVTEAQGEFLCTSVAVDPDGVHPPPSTPRIPPGFPFRPPSSPPASSDTDLSGGAIAGIVIGSLLFCLCCCVLTGCALRQQTLTRESAAADSQPKPKKVETVAAENVYAQGGAV